MRAINHALTGAIIGLTVGEPFVAIPVAVASHYLLDIIPHSGNKSAGDASLKSISFRISLYLDAMLCFLLVAILVSIQPQIWLLAAACAFFAAAPDLVSYRRYKMTLNNKIFKPNKYEKFAHDIQWFERPIGAVVEIAWFIAGIFLLYHLLFL